jgi:hypothetical protein
VHDHEHKGDHGTHDHDHPGHDAEIHGHIHTKKKK